MRFDTRYLMLGIFAIILFALGGCSEDITAPVAETLSGDVQAKNSNVVTQDGVTRHEGIFGGENLYAILVPDDWNGELVVYAHGFVDADEPLVLPDKDNAPEIRDAVVDMGFAWAYCSYRENGMAVKDGAWATRQLTKIFRATVKSAPTYTWLMANSLGGLIVTLFASERGPEVAGVVTSGAALTLSSDVSPRMIALANALAPLLPRIRLDAKIDPAGLSRSPEVVQRYCDDPLVFSKVTLSMARALFGAIRRSASAGSRIRVPMLLLHGEDDPTCPVVGSRLMFAQLEVGRAALTTYPGLLHEIFNEPEHERVFEDLLGWLLERTG